MSASENAGAADPIGSPAVTYAAAPPSGRFLVVLALITLFFSVVVADYIADQFGAGFWNPPQPGPKPNWGGVLAFALIAGILWGWVALGFYVRRRALRERRKLA